MNLFVGIMTVVFTGVIATSGIINCWILFQISKKDEEYKLILDFDGFAKDIAGEDCLRVTDDLHDIILKEYEETIKEPVYEYMRQER